MPVAFDHTEYIYPAAYIDGLLRFARWHTDGPGVNPDIVVDYKVLCCEEGRIR
jgi:hypothetical protein